MAPRAGSAFYEPAGEAEAELFDFACPFLRALGPDP